MVLVFKCLVGRRTLKDEQVLEASCSEVMGSTVPFLVVLLLQRSIFCVLGGTSVMLMISEECEWACPFHIPYCLTDVIFTHDWIFQIWHVRIHLSFLCQSLTGIF